MLVVGRVSRRSAPSPLLFSWVVATFFLFVVLVLFMGKYAKKEEVDGRVLKRDLVRVAAQNAGHIEEVLVREGQPVTKGQPLLRISTAAPDTLLNGASGKAALALEIEQLLSSTQSDVDRINQEGTTQQLLITRQLAQLRQRLAIVEDAGKSIERRLASADSERRRYSDLATERLVSQSAVDDLQNRYETVQQELSGNRSEAIAIRQHTLELEQRRSELTGSIAARLRDLALQRRDLTERLEALNKSAEHAVLSPIDGTVEAIHPFKGSPVLPAQPLLMLRSGASTEVATILFDVPSTAIGFVKEGTEVAMRFVAFPYERWGVVKGSVVRVTPGTLRATQESGEGEGSGVFQIEVVPSFDHAQTRIQQAWLRDGMKVQAALRLQDLSLMEWLFLPVQKGIKRNPDYLPAAEASVTKE